MSLADVWENLRFVLSAAAVLALVAAVVVGPRWAARAPVALPTVFEVSEVCAVDTSRRPMCL